MCGNWPLLTAFLLYLCLAALWWRKEIRPERDLRTPDSQFENLKGFDFSPNYLEIGELRIHYVDEGPKDGKPIFLLHGQPTWGYLFRHMIPPLVEAGYRVIVPDMVVVSVASDKPDAKRRL